MCIAYLYRDHIAMGSLHVYALTHEYSVILWGDLGAWKVSS